MQIKITVRFFGAARELAPDPFFSFFFTAGGTIKNVRQCLNLELQKINEIAKNEVQKNEKQKLISNILNSSVFASESEILAEDDLIYQDITLALIPPVCGG